MVTCWRVCQRWERRANPLFPQAADRADQRVPGPRADIGFLVSRWLLHRRQDAVTCALVPAVGQDRHFLREREDRGQNQFPGRGQVIHVARQDVRDPHRPAVGVEKGLDIAAEVLLLPRVPQVDLPALPAGRLLMAAVRVDDLAAEDDVRGALGQGAGERVAQFRRLFGEDVDDLGEVAVGGGLRQAEPGTEPADVGLVPEPGEPELRLPAAARLAAVFCGFRSNGGGRRAGPQRTRLDPSGRRA
jgi:hypothetical protein